MIGRFETFTFALSSLSACWNKIASDELKPLGLKGGYILYLIALYKHEDGLTATQLCDMCGRDKAEVSRAVSAMLSKGLVDRVNTTVNGYRANIMLTDYGREITFALRERVKLAVEKGGAGLTDMQRESFYSAMETISGNLKNIIREGL